MADLSTIVQTLDYLYADTQKELPRGTSQKQAMADFLNVALDAWPEISETLKDVEKMRAELFARVDVADDRLVAHSLNGSTVTAHNPVSKTISVASKYLSPSD